MHQILEALISFKKKNTKRHKRTKEHIGLDIVILRNFDTLLSNLELSSILKANKELHS